MEKKWVKLIEFCYFLHIITHLNLLTCWQWNVRHLLAHPHLLPTPTASDCWLLFLSRRTSTTVTCPCMILVLLLQLTHNIMHCCFLYSKIKLEYILVVILRLSNSSALISYLIHCFYHTMDGDVTFVHRPMWLSMPVHDLACPIRILIYFLLP